MSKTPPHEPSQKLELPRAQEAVGQKAQPVVEAAKSGEGPDRKKEILYVGTGEVTEGLDSARARGALQTIAGQVDESMSVENGKAQELLNLLDSHPEIKVAAPKYDGKTGARLTPTEQLKRGFARLMERYPGPYLFNNLPGIGDIVRWVREHSTQIASFYNEDERLQLHAPSSEQKREGYLFLGTPQVEGAEVTDVQADSRGFYKSLIFWENRSDFHPEIVQAVLGPDLFQEVQELKRRILHEDMRENPVLLAYLRAVQGTMVRRRQGIPQTTVMVHGVQHPGTFAEVPELQRKVKRKFGRQEGIRVNIPVAGNPGVFFSPNPDGYGRIEDGSKIVFFADDLLESHISVSFDPNHGDGLVARDSKTGALVEVPNRVLRNPQAGTVEGVNLGNWRMAEYLLQLEHTLMQNPDLVHRVEEAGLQYEREVLGGQFLEAIGRIRTKLRGRGVTEGLVLGARDHYTRHAINSGNDSQHLAEVEKRILEQEYKVVNPETNEEVIF